MWLDFEGFILLRQMSVCLSVCPVAFLCVTILKPLERFYYENSHRGYKYLPTSVDTFKFWLRPAPIYEGLQVFWRTGREQIN
jgi:hypothetical protein